MTVLARMRAARMAPRITAYAERYETTAVARIPEVQLFLLNAAWTEALARSPWARAMQSHFDLPIRFDSWKTFDAVVPVMNKQALREVVAAGRKENDAAKIDWRATGGSTAQPFQFPAWPQEQNGAALDIWLGRRRLGINPDDPLFLIWGHAHRLGSGARGALKRMKRRLADRLLGYSRFSAYDLCERNLDRARELLLRSGARYVVGYATALDRFARANVHHADEIAPLGLKAVIATAERFPRPDSRDVIARCFGAPAVMEYGAEETGALAYESTPGEYGVFWARHRLELRGGDGPLANEVVVTSLYPRAMPLMRYALGDLAQVNEGQYSDAPLIKLASIQGRCNEIVTLPNGVCVHSQAFSHCMRDASKVRAFQLVAAPGSWPRLRYEAPTPLGDSAVAEIRRRFAVLEPQLAQMSVERVDRLATSIAGKHRMVVDS